MTEMEYIKQLEERIEKLEKFISNITMGEEQNISFNDCTLADICSTYSHTLELHR